MLIPARTKCYKFSIVNIENCCCGACVYATFLHIISDASSHTHQAIEAKLVERIITNI